MAQSTFNYNGNTYLLTTTGTWQQAQAEAQSLGGNLVTINSQAEQNWLVSTFGGNEVLWIGLTDEVTEGQFQWVSGETVTYTNWYAGEPNDVNGGEDYGAMNWGSSGKWNDMVGKNPDSYRGIIEIVAANNTFNGGAGNDILNGGAGNNTLNGGAGNDTLNGGAGNDTLNGGLGDDIYIVDSTTDTITENANEGTDAIQSSVTFSLAALPNIENLTLTGTNAINGTGNAGNNVITGNTGNNTINGGAGNDTLNGGAGNDTLNGGAGNDTLNGGLGDDTYIVDSTTDRITENANEGTDAIQSSVTFSLAALPNIENLTLTGTNAINGTGNAGNNVITGNTGNNTLNGGAGNDTLNGGVGNDTLNGGLGDDTYIVDSTTDRITENANEGTDAIQSSVTFSLAALPNIENLTLTGTAAINGTGNAGNNVITGNTGNNTLNAGAGVDTLIGNGGNDILNGEDGNDLLYGDVADYGGSTLFNYNGNIYLLTTAGTWQQAQAEAQSLGGNLVTINSQAEQDWLVNTFGGDEALWIGLTDEVTEGQFQWISGETVIYTNWYAGEPNDVNGGEDYGAMNWLSPGEWNDLVGKNPDSYRGIIEIVAGNDSLNGGAGNDTLNGSAGNDTLNGGTGIDTLIGGADDDTYIVDSATDTITENANEGADTIQSSVTFSLAALPNIENLTLTGITAIDGTGNAGNNVITGNTGNNILNGEDGNDLLYGDVADYGGSTLFNYNGSTYLLTTAVTWQQAQAEAQSLGGNLVTINSQAEQDWLVNTFGGDEFLWIGLTDEVTEGQFQWVSGETVTYTNWYAGEPNDVNGGEDYGAMNWLSPGEWNDMVDGSYRGIIEIVAGNDSLNGGAGNDTLNGGAGNDTLNGGTGVDTLIGGADDDTYIVDSATDTITENANEGADTIQSSVTFSLAALPNIENLTLTGIAAINGTGNAGNNVITGNAGNNTLNAGAGVDTLIGNGGNDILNGEDGNDLLYGDVADYGGSTLFNYNGSTYLLTTAGTWQQAQAEAQSLGGNLVTINSQAEQDWLVNTFGGDEALWIGLTDEVTEGQFQWVSGETVSYTNWYAGEPNDVNGGEDYGAMNWLSPGQWNDMVDGSYRGIIEIVAGNDSLNGGAGNDTLNGGAGNDSLNGGTGIDTLIGGIGNDTYIVDSATDTITENANEGADTIQSSVTFSLAALPNIENLTLTGTAAINATGNAGNNVITGNAGNNTLNGAAGNDTLNGGTGVDTLIGGIGNDTYIVDSATDTITENANEGADTIQSSVTFSLAALPNIENLTLTGTNAINGTGNAGNNVIIGNAGNNTLNGGAGNDRLTGGTGKDSLTGGLGVDRFDYRQLADSVFSNFDVITAFNATDDRFLVATARSAFNNVGTVATLDAAGIAAQLTSGTFTANSAAQFSFGSRTFVAINNATAGFSATADAIVEVTGLTGTLGLNNFTTTLV